MVADEPSSDEKSPVAELIVELVKLIELGVIFAPPESDRLPLKLRA